MKIKPRRINGTDSYEGKIKVAETGKGNVYKPTVEKIKHTY